MRGMLNPLGAVVICLTAASSLIQPSIRIGAIAVIAQESEPRRFSEPHLALDPSQPNHLLVAVWSASTTADPNQDRRCATFASVDGGASWSRHDFALANCYDAQVAVLPDGQAVFSALATLPGVQPNRDDWLVVFHSGDGGATWDDRPTTLGYRFDHPAIAADTGSSPRKGWIYLTSHLEWRDGTPQRKSAVVVTRSRDGGRTFDVPTMVAPNALHNFAEMPIVTADGTLVVAFVEDAWAAPFAERRRAWIVRSIDGGVTFSAPQLVNQECGPPPAFQLSSLAVDASNGSRDRLYFACRQSGGGPVIVTRSSDGGNTWMAPGVAVGPREPNRDARRVMTTAVNGNGVVGVMIVQAYAESGDSCLSVEFAASLDGASTFLPSKRVSASPCGSSAADDIAKRRFPTYGDYFGLAAMRDGAFRLVWPEMRGGMSALLTATITIE